MIATRAILVLAAGALVAAGCSTTEVRRPAAPTTTPDRQQSDALTRVSPLTGLPMIGQLPDRPVVVAKIDNTRAARPQIGLDHADLVVEELVEGGLTRLAAFYYADLPAKVGPVRSIRTTDIGIAAPVDARIVASGGAPVTNRRVKAAGLTYYTQGPGFRRESGRPRLYSVMVDLGNVLRGKSAVPIPRPYFAWTNQSAAEATAKVTRANVRFSGGSVTRWGLKDGAWIRTNGLAAPGAEFRADTMIVIFADVGNAGYLDPAGNRVPETDFVGTGKALIFHRNAVTKATWRKNSLGSTLNFTGESGAPLQLNPGKVWIELVPKSGGAVSYD